MWVISLSGLGYRKNGRSQHVTRHFGGLGSVSNQSPAPSGTALAAGFCVYFGAMTPVASAIPLTETVAKICSNCSISAGLTRW